MAASRGVVRVVFVLLLLGAMGGAMGAPAAGGDQTASGVSTASPATDYGDGHGPGGPPTPIATNTTQGPAGAKAHLVELYPNPVPRGDPGEYVAVAFTEPTNVSGWQLEDDGIQTAALPNTTIEGTVAFSTEPETARNFTDYPVKELSGWFQLADDREAVALITDDGTKIDQTAYENAPRATRYVNTTDGWAWRHRGATDFAPTTATDVSGAAFVLPDSPNAVHSRLESAADRILLAGYTLTSPRVVEILKERHEAGVKVEVLLEGTPVGGISEAQVRKLDRLVAAGIPVTVIDGPYDRYRFHHAKYAVIDDSALVLTENWKPAGTGGKSSRGWGFYANDSTLAGDLTETFWADAGWKDGIAWEDHRETVDPVPADPATGVYQPHHQPEPVDADAVTLAHAPESAADVVTEQIRAAEDSIQILQVTINHRDFKLLEETLAAAGRGVSVEIVLDDSWYVQEDNEEIETALEAVAEREDLDLTVERLEGGNRFGKIHAKGIIIDEEVTVLGSANWNGVAYGDNREVILTIEDEAVAAFYGSVLDEDRGESAWDLPAGLGGLVLGGWAVVALYLGRRVKWDGPRI